MITEIDRKKRQIRTIRQRLYEHNGMRSRNYIQTTGRNDSMADMIAQLVDLESEVKKLEEGVKSE